jgi:hypothetical protein
MDSQMADAKEKPDHWYSTFAGWELGFDRCLKISEAVVVITITFILVLLVFRQVHWVWIACNAADRQSRIEQSLRMVNDNWKVGLLILIPLFYRTTRMFLQRVRKAGWFEAEPEGEVKTLKTPPLAKEDEEE